MAERICSNCGNKAGPNDRFCNNCGQALADQPGASQGGAFVAPPQEPAAGFTPAPAAPDAGWTAPPPQQQGAQPAFIPPPAAQPSPQGTAFVPPPAQGQSVFTPPPAAGQAPAASGAPEVPPPPPLFAPPSANAGQPAAPASVFGRQGTPQAARPAAPFTPPPASTPPRGQQAQPLYGAVPPPAGMAGGGTVAPVKKKSSTGCIIAGCVGALVVVGIIILVVVLVMRNAGKLLSETGVEINSTPIIRPAATKAATEKPAKLATSAPVARADILYEDDFSSTDSGWDVWEDEDSAGGYENGKYVLQVFKTDTFYWAYLGQNYDDFVLDVDATKQAGPDDNGFGVIFRYQDAQNFYRFGISSDGFYELGYYENDEWTSLMDWTETEVIKQGNKTNHLTLICEGSNITVAVNGETLASFSDETFTSGDVGVFAGATTEAGVKIAFDNFTVSAVK